MITPEQSFDINYCPEFLIQHCTKYIYHIDKAIYLNSKLDEPKLTHICEVYYNETQEYINIIIPFIISKYKEAGWIASYQIKRPGVVIFIIAHPKSIFA